MLRRMGFRVIAAEDPLQGVGLRPQGTPAPGEATEGAATYSAFINSSTTEVCGR
jgi:hypothetical protein